MASSDTTGTRTSGAEPAPADAVDLARANDLAHAGEIGDVDDLDAAIAYDPVSGDSVPRLVRVLEPVTRGLGVVSVVLVSVALLAELVVVLLNVVLRNVEHHSLTWVPEISEAAIAVMTFVGGALAYHKGMHIALRLVVDRLPPMTRDSVRALAEIVVLVTSLVLARYSWSVMSGDWDAHTPILGFSVGWIDLPIFVGSVLFAYYSVLRLAEFARRAVAIAGAVMVLLAVILLVTKTQWVNGYNEHAVAYTLVLFVVLLVVSVPISITLAILAMAYAWANGFGGLATIPRQMGDGVNSFLLLAVPFFVFAGFVMAYGGLSRRIADISELVIGRLPGGPLQVVVGSMYVFSGMSGSKNADVVAVGLTMKEMADRAGYTPEESGAVLGASAAMGETIPPSIAMLILGSVASVPVATLLIAGLLPAAALAVLLMIVIGFRYRARRRPRRDHGGVTGVLVTLAKSLPAVALPVILAGGIIGGIGTPTEVSSFAAVYGLALGILAYRKLTPRTLARTLRETAELTGFVMYIVSTAAAFAYALTLMQLPQDVAAFVARNLDDSKTLFLLASCVVLVVLGCVLEGVPAILVAAPVLFPVAQQLGIWHVQFGIVLLIAMGIGTFTPPLGIGTYVVCSVTGCTPGALGRKIWPYLLVLFGGLVLVALVPGITSALPSLFNMPR